MMRQLLFLMLSFFAVGTGGASVSGNDSQSKIDSTYTSVREQSGFGCTLIFLRTAVPAFNIVP